MPGKQRWSLAGPSCTLNLGYRVPKSEYLGRNLNREKLKGLGCRVSGLGMQTSGTFWGCAPFGACLDPGTQYS